MAGVILHDIPPNSDVVFLALDAEFSDVTPTLNRPGEAWICPSDDSPRTGEKAFLDRSATLPVRLFREYSCYKLVHPPA